MNMQINCVLRTCNANISVSRGEVLTTRGYTNLRLPLPLPFDHSKLYGH